MTLSNTPMTSFLIPDFIYMVGKELASVKVRGVDATSLCRTKTVCSHFEFHLCISCNGLAQLLLCMFLDGILDVFTSSIIECIKFWTNGELRRHYSLKDTLQ